MYLERSIDIYVNVLTRLFNTAHNPYTDFRQYSKATQCINEILNRIKIDYGCDFFDGGYL